MGGPLCKWCTSFELDGFRVLSSEVVYLCVQRGWKLFGMDVLRRSSGDATRCGVSVVRQHVMRMELSSPNIEGYAL